VKKITLICLSLILALGVMGVGFALWYEELFIDVEVNTGEFDVNWSVEGYYDSEAPEKDVSSVYATGAGTKYLDIVVTNAYPCIEYTVEFNVECTGTVPAHFLEPEIYVDPDIDGAITFTDLAGNPIDWSQIQLHTGEAYLGKCVIHLNNSAGELAQYYARVRLIGYQYNEDNEAATWPYPAFP